MSTTRPRPPGRWGPGQSGNPAGRPKGKSPAAKLRESIEKEIPAILTTLVDAAKAGDVNAARALLDRAMPPLKSVELPVSLDIQGDTLTDKGRSILGAVASGHVTPTQGAALMGALSGLARLVELDEFDARLKALEAAKDAHAVLEATPTTATTERTTP